MENWNALLIYPFGVKQCNFWHIFFVEKLLVDVAALAIANLQSISTDLLTRILGPLPFQSH